MRVILADDHALFRKGVALLLAETGIDVVGQVDDGAALVEAVAADPPDAVVTDVRMPPTGTIEGLEAALRIRQHHPEVAVLVLSAYVETLHAVDLLGDRRGGTGYLLKERVFEATALADALQRLCRGESVVDPEVVSVLLGDPRQPDVLSRLTDRETEILALMAEGRSNQGISTRLFLSPKTVESHVRSVFTKLDLPPAPDDHRRVLAVLTYLRR